MILFHSKKLVISQIANKSKLFKKWGFATSGLPHLQCELLINLEKVAVQIADKHLRCTVESGEFFLPTPNVLVGIQSISRRINSQISTKNLDHSIFQSHENADVNV